MIPSVDRGQFELLFSSTWNPNSTRSRFASTDRRRASTFDPLPECEFVTLAVFVREKRSESASHMGDMVSKWNNSLSGHAVGDGPLGRAGRNIRKPTMLANTNRWRIVLPF